MSAIAPMTSLVKFNFSVSSHQCLLPLQLSFIFCECLGWQNSAVETFQSLSVSRKFILFVLHYIVCNILLWQSVHLAPSVVTNRYRTPRLNKIFGSYFLVFGKCGVTPHRLYGVLLTLRWFKKIANLDCLKVSECKGTQNQYPIWFYSNISMSGKMS